MARAKETYRAARRNHVLREPPKAPWGTMHYYVEHSTMNRSRVYHPPVRPNKRDRSKDAV